MEILDHRVTDYFYKKMSVKDWQKSHFNELKKKNKPVSYQLERVAHGGVKQTIDVTAVYMSYQGQEYILSMARDITEQLRIQNNLKASEDLYRLLSEGAGDGIFLMDTKGRIQYVNKALEQMTGIPFTESRGQYYQKYVEKKSLLSARNTFLKAKKGVLGIHEEIEILDRNGQPLPVEINVSPVYKNGKMVSIHAIIRDIRGRKQIEHLVLESEKLKAVQYFITGTAQEIKHPLKAVLNRLGALLQRYRLQPFEYIGHKEFHELLGSIESIGHQLKNCYDTTERLVDINKKKAGMDRSFCDANAVIRELVDVRKTEMQVNEIQKKVSLGKDLPLLAMGKIEFQQVVSNVIDNALQAMPSGGLLVIRTVYLKDEGKVMVEIKDEGVGISRENLPHIFEPFFTTRSRGIEKNAGLGLSIAFSLVKSCRGDIQVVSSLRKGTTVKIIIPETKRKAGIG